MKLKEYIKGLNDLTEKYPESLEMEVIYSKDDEGNSYQKVNMEPSLYQIEDLDKYQLEVVGGYDEEEEDIDLKDCNAVCIN